MNHSDAGKPADTAPLTDIPALLDAYAKDRPDPGIPGQRVVFGTSGHRGSSLATTFNEGHILAVTQAICLHRQAQGIDGPLFIGFDTHALSRPAFETALEVLAANGVEILAAGNDEFTPTPAISQAILVHNRGRTTGLADGIVITPSHNPPEDGGFKYNPPHGGPADSKVTGWIEAKANELLGDLGRVKRMTLEAAKRAPNLREFDFVQSYVGDLGNVIDMEAIRGAGLNLAVDALGGAGLGYWSAIADRYKLDFTIRNAAFDPAFRFMTLDWDGRIRMDPSSPFAMRSLIDLKDRFDLALACDTDHDRHGIVTPTAGLMPPNHYLAVCADYLLANRPEWKPGLGIGKTAVTSAMLDRVAGRRGRAVLEVPVGFKWFVDGLVQGALGFVGEESAGATLLRRDGSVWTTDKDGIAVALLAAEITARTGRDPGALYKDLERDLGAAWYSRTDAPATPAQKKTLSALSGETVKVDTLAGEPVQQVLSRTGDGNALGGIKVVAANGWFAARPSGTENVYKIYAESFVDQLHLSRIEQDAQAVVGAALASA